MSGLVDASNVTKKINLTRGNVIGWKVYATDSDNQWNYTDVFTFIVENTPPFSINLSWPANNSNLTTRLPFFNWTPAYDPDGDNVTYDIIVQEDPTCGLLLGIECIGVDMSQNGINGTNFSSTKILGADTWYNWTVRGTDGYDYIDWAEPFNFSIIGTVSITLECDNGCNNLIEFGDVWGAPDNTTDNSPGPFVVENDGNVFVNIWVNATSLWNTQPLDTKYYQFMVGNSTEANSFNWSNSSRDWEYMTDEEKWSIAYLNYTNTSDLGEIELLVEVPSGEGAGSKNTIVTLKARYYDE